MRNMKIRINQTGLNTDWLKTIIRPYKSVTIYSANFDGLRVVEKLKTVLENCERL
jgi:hypothetical protein